MSAAAAQTSPGNLKTVADKPPAPTAEAVLEQRASKGARAGLSGKNDRGDGPCRARDGQDCGAG